MGTDAIRTAWTGDHVRTTPGPPDGGPGANLERPGRTRCVYLTRLTARP